MKSFPENLTVTSLILVLFILENIDVFSITRPVISSVGDRLIQCLNRVQCYLPLCVRNNHYSDVVGDYLIAKTVKRGKVVGERVSKERRRGGKAVVAESNVKTATTRELLKHNSKDSNRLVPGNATSNSMSNIIGLSYVELLHKTTATSLLSRKFKNKSKVSPSLEQSLRKTQNVPAEEMYWKNKNVDQFNIRTTADLPIKRKKLKSKANITTITASYMVDTEDERVTGSDTSAVEFRSIIAVTNSLRKLELKRNLENEFSGKDYVAQSSEVTLKDKRINVKVSTDLPALKKRRKSWTNSSSPLKSKLLATNDVSLPQIIAAQSLGASKFKLQLKYTTKSDKIALLDTRMNKSQTSVNVDVVLNKLQMTATAKALLKTSTIIKNPQFTTNDYKDKLLLRNYQKTRAPNFKFISPTVAVDNKTAVVNWKMVSQGDSLSTPVNASKDNLQHNRTYRNHSTDITAEISWESGLEKNISSWISVNGIVASTMTALESGDDIAGLDSLAKHNSNSFRFKHKTVPLPVSLRPRWSDSYARDMDYFECPALVTEPVTKRKWISTNYTEWTGACPPLFTLQSCSYSSNVTSAASMSESQTSTTTSLESITQERVIDVTLNSTLNANATVTCSSVGVTETSVNVTNSTDFFLLTDSYRKNDTVNNATETANKSTNHSLADTLRNVSNSSDSIVMTATFPPAISSNVLALNQSLISIVAFLYEISPSETVTEVSIKTNNFTIKNVEITENSKRTTEKADIVNVTAETVKLSASSKGDNIINIFLISDSIFSGITNQTVLRRLNSSAVVDLMDINVKNARNESLINLTAEEKTTESVVTIDTAATANSSTKTLQVLSVNNEIVNKSTVVSTQSTVKFTLITRGILDGDNWAASITTLNAAKHSLAKETSFINRLTINTEKAVLAIEKVNSNSISASFHIINSSNNITKQHESSPTRIVQLQSTHVMAAQSQVVSNDSWMRSSRATEPISSAIAVERDGTFTISKAVSTNATTSLISSDVSYIQHISPHVRFSSTAQFEEEIANIDVIDTVNKYLLNMTLLTCRSIDSDNAFTTAWEELVDATCPSLETKMIARNRTISYKIWDDWFEEGEGGCCPFSVNASRVPSTTLMIITATKSIYNVTLQDFTCPSIVTLSPSWKPKNWTVNERLRVKKTKDNPKAAKAAAIASDERFGFDRRKWWWMDNRTSMPGINYNERYSASALWLWTDEEPTTWKPIIHLITARTVQRTPYSYISRMTSFRTTSCVSVSTETPLTFTGTFLTTTVTCSTPVYGPGWTTRRKRRRSTMSSATTKSRSFTRPTTKRLSVPTYCLDTAVYGLRTNTPFPEQHYSMDYPLKIFSIEITQYYESYTEDVRMISRVSFSVTVARWVSTPPAICSRKQRDRRRNILDDDGSCESSVATAWTTMNTMHDGTLGKVAVRSVSTPTFVGDSDHLNKQCRDLFIAETAMAIDNKLELNYKDVDAFGEVEYISRTVRSDSANVPDKLPEVDRKFLTTGYDHLVKKDIVLRSGGTVQMGGVGLKSRVLITGSDFADGAFPKIHKLVGYTGMHYIEGELRKQVPNCAAITCVLTLMTPCVTECLELRTLSRTFNLSRRTRPFKTDCYFSLITKYSWEASPTTAFNYAQRCKTYATCYARHCRICNVSHDEVQTTCYPGLSFTLKCTCAYMNKSKPIVHVYVATTTCSHRTSSRMTPAEWLFWHTTETYHFWTAPPKMKCHEIAMRQVWATTHPPPVFLFPSKRSDKRDVLSSNSLEQNSPSRFGFPYVPDVMIPAQYAMACDHMNPMLFSTVLVPNENRFQYEASETSSPPITTQPPTALAQLPAGSSSPLVSSQYIHFIWHICNASETAFDNPAGTTAALSISKESSHQSQRRFIVYDNPVTTTSSLYDAPDLQNLPVTSDSVIVTVLTLNPNLALLLFRGVVTTTSVRRTRPTVRTTSQPAVKIDVNNATWVNLESLNLALRFLMGMVSTSIAQTTATTATSTATTANSNNSSVTSQVPRADTVWIIAITTVTKSMATFTSTTALTSNVHMTSVITLLSSTTSTSVASTTLTIAFINITVRPIASISITPAHNVLYLTLYLCDNRLSFASDWHPSATTSKELSFSTLNHLLGLAMAKLVTVKPFTTHYYLTHQNSIGISALATKRPVTSPTAMSFTAVNTNLTFITLSQQVITSLKLISVAPVSKSQRSVVANTAAETTKNQRLFSLKFTPKSSPLNTKLQRAVNDKVPDEGNEHNSLLLLMRKLSEILAKPENLQTADNTITESNSVAELLVSVPVVATCVRRQYSSHKTIINSPSSTNVPSLKMSPQDGCTKPILTSFTQITLSGHTIVPLNALQMRQRFHEAVSTQLEPRLSMSVTPHANFKLQSPMVYRGVKSVLLPSITLGPVCVTSRCNCVTVRRLVTRTTTTTTTAFRTVTSAMYTTTSEGQLMMDEAETWPFSDYIDFSLVSTALMSETSFCTEKETWETGFSDLVILTTATCEFVSTIRLAPWLLNKTISRKSYTNIVRTSGQAPTTKCPLHHSVMTVPGFMRSTSRRPTYATFQTFSTFKSILRRLSRSTLHVQHSVSHNRSASAADTTEPTAEYEIVCLSTITRPEWLHGSTQRRRLHSDRCVHNTQSTASIDHSSRITLPAWKTTTKCFWSTKKCECTKRERDVSELLCTGISCYVCNQCNSKEMTQPTTSIKSLEHRHHVVAESHRHWSPTNQIAVTTATSEKQQELNLTPKMARMMLHNAVYSSIAVTPVSHRPFMSICTYGATFQQKECCCVTRAAAISRKWTQTYSTTALRTTHTTTSTATTTTTTTTATTTTTTATTTTITATTTTTTATTTTTRATTRATTTTTTATTTATTTTTSPAVSTHVTQTPSSRSCSMHAGHCFEQPAMLEMMIVTSSKCQRVTRVITLTATTRLTTFTSTFTTTTALTTSSTTSTSTFTTTKMTTSSTTCTSTFTTTLTTLSITSTSTVTTATSLTTSTTPVSTRTTFVTTSTVVISTTTLSKCSSPSTTKLTSSFYRLTTRTSDSPPSVDVHRPHSYHFSSREITFTAARASTNLRMTSDSFELALTQETEVTKMSHMTSPAHPINNHFLAYQPTTLHLITPFNFKRLVVEGTENPWSPEVNNRAKPLMLYAMWLLRKNDTRLQFSFEGKKKVKKSVSAAIRTTTQYAKIFAILAFILCWSNASIK